jgi:site-specific recombinase XerD
MKQTFSILIWAYRGKQKENEATLYARVTVNGKRAEISLSRKVQLDQWDDKASMMKGKSAEALDVNEYLDIVRGKLRQHYYEFKSTGQEISAEAIKNKYLGIDEERRTLLQLLKYHNKDMKALIGNRIAHSTYKGYVVLHGKIERFIKAKYKVSDISLVDLKYRFISDFEYFLKTTDKLKHNTCIRYLKILKKIANVAVKNEWLTRNPFQGFKCATEEVNREVLTEEEIENLSSKVLPSERLEEVRDIFIFSCYTGYAYADVLALTPEHIGVGLDGEKWIFTHRRKTDNRSNVLLLPLALELIEKYRCHPVCLSNGTLFPVKSNQKYNDYLKEIAALCGITKKLTTHIARHTFATTVTLSHDVPIETVSSMLGHKSIRTTQIYARIVQQKVSNDMKALRTRLMTKPPKARQG